MTPPLRPSCTPFRPLHRQGVGGESAMARRSFLALLAGAATAAGCKLQRAALNPRTFLLQPARADRAADSATHEGAGVLLVRPFRVAPAFDARAFVLRRGETEYTADAYNGFLLSPGPMLTEAFASWARDLGVFKTVTTGGSQLPATHALEGDVTDLCADYREPASPKAVLAVQVRLLHPVQASPPPILWQREERRAVPLPQANATALVDGWNAALAQILRSLEPDLGRREGGVGRGGTTT